MGEHQLQTAVTPAHPNGVPLTDDLQPQPAPQPRIARPRLDSVDMLRGLVMVFMALDHVRDFFGDMTILAIDPAKSYPALYFTRWISHFCAPTFVFLTGVGTFLYGSRGRTKGEVSWYLLSRGLWIVVIEAVVLSSLWRGGEVLIEHHLYGRVYAIFGQVFWAIGSSMVVLSALVWLPRPVILTFALLLIVGHNSVDGVKPNSFGDWGPVWQVLHAGGDVKLAPGVILQAAYPLIPWIGVLAAGYCFGPVLRMEKAERRTWILGLGAFLTVGFFALRATNLYGDLFPWTLQRDETHTVLSFLNCHKYPPSLCYLMMTLGPALLLLAAFERSWWPIGPVLTVFGRVPMFYYLLHLPLILILAALTVRFEVARGMYESVDALFKAGGLRFGLPAVYVTWLIVVAILYFPCRWYSRVKSRSNSVWLTYL
jgi:uncharacterized membrane protein